MPHQVQAKKKVNDMYTSLKKAALAAAVGLALAGCATVGNDFSAPNNVADTNFRHACLLYTSPSPRDS